MSEELMKRPHYGDEFVRRRAAELALPEIKRWIGAPESSDADLIGWTRDSQLVEILEDGDFLEDARDELVRQWVKCLRVELVIPVGAAVIYRGIAGKVVGSESSMALYHVRTPDMKENQWMVCAAEEVKASVSAVAA